jgi:hypothetical protein
MLEWVLIVQFYISIFTKRDAYGWIFPGFKSMNLTGKTIIFLSSIRPQFTASYFASILNLVFDWFLLFWSRFWRPWHGPPAAGEDWDLLKYVLLILTYFNTFLKGAYLFQSFTFSVYRWIKLLEKAHISSHNAWIDGFFG